MIEGLAVGDVATHYARSGVTRDMPVLITESGTFTWSDIDDHANRLANGLLSRGLTAQGKVAVLLWNDPRYYEVMFGVAKAGGVIVPLNARLVGREIAFALAHSHAEFLLTTADLLEPIEKAVSALDTKVRIILLNGQSEHASSYDEVLAGAPANAPAVRVSADAPYWLAFTSGTTGTPKAAVIPHRNLVTEWNTFGVESAITKEDTFLLAAPIFGGVGFVFGLCALYNGGRVVLMKQFDPAGALRLIEQHRVTVIPAAPTMLSMMLDRPEAQSHDVSSVRAVLAMGAALSTGLRKRVERFFAAGEGVYHPYGSTELGTCACIHPQQQEGHDGSVGQGFLGAEVRLLDSAGNDVAPGEVGEIYTRGKVLSTGYLDNPEATAAVRRGDWVTCNDLGRFDQDGFLYVVDRAKDMIVTGGFNVYSNEVEEIVSQYEGVGQVAVIGTPDEKWGEAVTAYIVPVPGASIEVDKLNAYCHENLAGYKCPKSTLVVESLPTSSTGKILKRVLRESTKTA